MSSDRATSTSNPSATGGGSSFRRADPSAPSHYQLLELSPAASAAELRQAFRSLSKRYHPDTTTLPAAEAREAFTRLRQAYAVLADPASRRAYDAALRLPLTPVPVPPLPSGPAGAQPIGVRRSLSGGEWFALVLLGLALALSLVLGVGLAWARGTALITQPSWWSEEPGRPATAAPGPTVQPAPPLMAVHADPRMPGTAPSAHAETGSGVGAIRQAP
ncbi:MAG: J domain-containing protein [Cyanobium sp.]